MPQIRQGFLILFGLWLLGLLAFRFSFLIFTHNSVTLSAYLSFIFTFVPGWILLQLRSVVRRSTEPSLPLQKTWTPIKHSGRRWKSNGLKLVAICMIYYYGLRVRHVEFDPTKVDMQAKYFLAVNFWDNEAVLPHFFNSIYDLASYLGPQNIFLSITENDSRDDTRKILLSYERELLLRNIPYRLRTDDGLRTKGRHDNPDVPWLTVSDRMNYMADVRNRALEPLYESTVDWKRVIFFNDVFFDWRGIMALLATEGEVVCSLDLDGGGLYDSWVLKDQCGEAVSLIWPYFWHPDDQKNVASLKPFEVGNCWNGIASLNALPFLNSSMLLYNISEPLRFPNNTAGCYQSECTALPLKLIDITKSDGPRAVVHPDVTVTYTKQWWNWYAVIMRLKIVEWWIHWVERPISWVWWPWLAPMTRWKGLDVKGEVECIIPSWDRCMR
ncbi:cryptococcal mannosyltransferase 1-domain-containing protein [Pyronema omphalodes]|nr:cryptococcal mannosyltransferase 1-domain-containing protein [Pyronema omphalodes]